MEDYVDGKLSDKSLIKLGKKAYQMAMGRRESEHDNCIYILIDYVERLLKEERL